MKPERAPLIQRVAPVSRPRVGLERIYRDFERPVGRLTPTITREIEARTAEADMRETVIRPFGPMTMASNELERPNRPENGKVAAEIHANRPPDGSGAVLNRPCGASTSRVDCLREVDYPEIQNAAPVKGQTNGENARSEWMREASRRLDGNGDGLKARCAS